MKTNHLSVLCRSAVALSIALSVGGCSKGKQAAPIGSSSAGVTSTAKIELVEKEFDFGTVTEGDTVEHTFVIKNVGTTPLMINNVRSSCGCTAAVTKEKEVPPGSTTELKVSFNTEGRMGPNRKTITIHSNDAETPNARVDIKANIERLLGFKPTIVRLSGKHGEMLTAEALLTGKLVKDAKLKVGAVTGQDGLTAELIMGKDGDVEVPGVKLSMKAAKVGRVNGSVDVETGLGKPAKLALPFNITVEGNVEVRPRALYFDGRSERNRPRVLRVSSSVAGFKIKSVSVSQGMYKAELIKPETGPGYEVSVRYTGDEKAENLVQGTLVIESNDALEPKIEVPLQTRKMPDMLRPNLMRKGPGGLVQPGQGE